VSGLNKPKNGGSSPAVEVGQYDEYGDD